MILPMFLAGVVDPSEAGLIVDLAKAFGFPGFLCLLLVLGHFYLEIVRRHDVGTKIEGSTKALIENTAEIRGMRDDIKQLVNMFIYQRGYSPPPYDGYERRASHGAIPPD